MPDEAVAKITDRVQAELIDCTPAPVAEATVVIPRAPDASPVQQARDATLATTGADPPPVEG